MKILKILLKCWICKKAYEEDEVDFWEAYWLNVANLKVNL